MTPIRLTAAKKPAKYRNRKTLFGGIMFDSSREAARWAELCILEKRGDIRALRRQVAYELAPAVRLAGEKRQKPALKLVVDFEYTDPATNRTIVEDVKSPASITEAFRVKQHLMMSVHGLNVKITK